MPMPANEIHEGERVVGVVDGLIMPAQGQPGDAAMVKLDELAVGLGALVGRHRPGRRLAPGACPRLAALCRR